MRIGKWIGGFFVSTAVNTSGTLFSFFGVIKFILLIVSIFVVMAFVAPPIVEWALDKTTSPEIKKLQKETAEYDAKVRELGETYYERNAEERALLHEQNEQKRTGMPSERNAQIAEIQKQKAMEAVAAEKEKLGIVDKKE